MASNGRSVKYNPLNPIGNASGPLVSPRLVKARGESKWVQAYEDDGNQAKSAAKSRKRPSRQKKAKEQSTFQPNGDSDAEIVTHLDMFEPDFDSDAQLSSAVSSHEGETFPFQDHQNFVEVVPPAPKRLETALDEADLIVENMLSPFSQPGTALDAIVAQSEDGREPPPSLPASKPPTISLEPPGDYKISAVQSEQKSTPLVESTLEMENPDKQTGLHEVALIAASERPGEVDGPAKKASAIEPDEHGQVEIENVQAASQQEAHTAIDSALLSELAALKKRVEMLESLSSPRDPPRQSDEFDEAQRGCWGSCLTACSSVNSPTCLPCPSLCKDDSEDLLSAQDEEEASPPTPTPEPTPAPPTPEPTPAPSHHSDEIEIAQAEGSPANEAPTWLGDIPPPPIEITPYTRLVYRDVFDGLYQEAVNTDTDKCKCGINCICPAQLCKCCPEGCFDKASQLSFDCTSLIKSKKSKKKVATPALNKARGVGWRIIARVAFPLVSDVFRDIWVVGEWLLVFLGFILSIVSFTAMNNTDAFNRTHLTLITLAFALSTLDVFTTLWECKSCKAGLEAYAKGRRENCCTRLQQQVEEGASDSMEVPLGLRPCWKITKNVADVARILAAELLFYPLLICDLIEFITSLPTNGTTFLDYLEDNAVDLILFLIGIASLVFYVYFMRLYVLGAGIAHLNTVRKPKVVNNSSEPPDETTSGKSKYNPSIKDTAYYYMSYFFFHVLIQMIAQICMIVTICFQIQQDIKVSVFSPSRALWFLMIAGYVLPLLGIFSFFIPTYFWASLEFPNTIYRDTLKILTMPGVDHVVCPDKSMKEVKEDSVIMFSPEDQAKYDKEYEELQKVSFFRKATYPFTQLHLVLLSMLYTGLQLAFILTATISIKNSGALDASLVFINLFANHYVFAVAGFWVMVFFIALCR